MYEKFNVTFKKKKNRKYFNDLKTKKKVKPNREAKQKIKN